MESGKAEGRWSDGGQFYVQLTVEPSGYATQEIVVGIDPGKKYSGIGVQSSKYTLYTAHLILPFPTVRERMDARRLMRRGRRGRRINRSIPYSQRAHRQKRFANRRVGKLAPSIRANRQLELRIVSELCKIYPVSEIRYEYVVSVTPTSFFVIRRPPYSRRQLDLMVPSLSGNRRKYGGSTTRHGVRKGDLVNSPKGIGYVSGDTEKQISVSDSNWKRLGQIAASKVSLIRRSTGLIVAC